MYLACRLMLAMTHEPNLEVDKAQTRDTPTKGKLALAQTRVACFMRQPDDSTMKQQAPGKRVPPVASFGSWFSVLLVHPATACSRLQLLGPRVRSDLLPSSRPSNFCWFELKTQTTAYRSCELNLNRELYPSAVSSRLEPGSIAVLQVEKRVH